MQKYFIPASDMQTDTVQLTGDAARHLIKVMRSAPGDLFVASDGHSREVIARIRQLDSSQVVADVIEERPRMNEPDVRVSIAQSMPKADKMETVIQKCTELGAIAILPFVSERTIVRYDHKKEQKRLERWRKIAQEAAEQADRNRIPEVKPPCSSQELARQFASYELVLFCYEQQLVTGLKTRIRQWQEANDGHIPMRMLVIVGPEGGFTEAEAAFFQQHGAMPTSLGRRILRTETAAMAALSCLLYEFNEMEG